MARQSRNRSIFRCLRPREPMACQNATAQPIRPTMIEPPASRGAFLLAAAGTAALASWTHFSDQYRTTDVSELARRLAATEAVATAMLQEAIKRRSEQAAAMTRDHLRSAVLSLAVLSTGRTGFRPDRRVHPRQQAYTDAGQRSSP